MTVVMRAPRTAGVGAGARLQRFGGRHPAALIGVVAAAVSAIGSGTPSPWGDEAASVLSAMRPLPSLFAELSRIDAVHAAYYLFLHQWVAVFGASDFAVRFPSAIAAGFAAAGTVVVGRQLFSARIGILAGLILTVMPQFTKMGMEARSYAFGVAAAVWLTSHLITTIRRGGHQKRSWILYAVGVAAAIYLFLYLVLLLIVHLVIILTARLPVRTQLRWAKSVGAGLLLATPILILGISQRGQIAFLARRDYATVHAVLVGQWFGSIAFAVLAWTLIVIGLLGAVRRGRRGSGTGVLTVVAWLTLPSAVLLAGNAFITPMYIPRYLTFGAPAAAILIAVGIHTIACWLTRELYRTAVLALLIAIIVGVAAPSYLAQRTPYAKDGGSDLRQVAQTIHDNAHVHDAVVFDETAKPSRKPRLAADLYPDQITGLVDLQLVTPYWKRAGLWDQVAPLDSLSQSLSRQRVVWAVELRGSGSTDQIVLEKLGFTLERTIPVHRTVIYKFVKESP